jgi:hypothetical protein
MTATVRHCPVILAYHAPLFVYILSSCRAALTRYPLLAITNPLARTTRGLLSAASFTHCSLLIHLPARSHHLLHILPPSPPFDSLTFIHSVACTLPFIYHLFCLTAQRLYFIIYRSYFISYTFIDEVMVNMDDACAGISAAQHGKSSTSVSVGDGNRRRKRARYTKDVYSA